MTPSIEEALRSGAVRLVPVEATEDTLDAYWHQTGESKEMRPRTVHEARRRYAAMLSASPDHTPALVALIEERDRLKVERDDAVWACGKATARALAAEAERDALREALADAAEAIEHWGAYASSYLQEKHDWAGDIARARAPTQETNDGE